MKVSLFPFQETALTDLRVYASEALGTYQRIHTPQVISFTAPTGAGKTIIMASFIESVFFGNEIYLGQTDAIFVWLSDSPELNEQSKLKIDTIADRIRIGQCVTVSDDSFDEELLEDGHIYFLNTQKLSKSSNLTKNGDNRRFTIWETLRNTVQEKSDRLYFIIDEAHRGMQGKEVGRATTIMQKFIKGSEEDDLNPMPLVIGMSATSERFNTLVEGTPSTIYRVIIKPDDVRSSGLLKDRIIISYSDETSVNKAMAVLQAAANDWKNKWDHWLQYCREQHHAYVNPVFVVQVENGTQSEISSTDLDVCLRKIEECTGFKFSRGEVVHTFGETNSSIEIAGLEVPYEEPSRIQDNTNIKVVFFKENLSTGWDCPRAETMMSFRRAKDATYIAQLLGRMVRTPMQMHILVDDTLNDVHLYLPFFEKETVEYVINAFQSSEGGSISTDIYGESIENKKLDTLSVCTQNMIIRKSILSAVSHDAIAHSVASHGDVDHTTISHSSAVVHQNGRLNHTSISQPTFNDLLQDDNRSEYVAYQGVAYKNMEKSDILEQKHIYSRSSNTVSDAVSNELSDNVNDITSNSEDIVKNAISNIDEEFVSSLPVARLDDFAQQEPTVVIREQEQSEVTDFNREKIVKAINDSGLLTYDVRKTRINDYLKSLFSLARLLSQTGLDQSVSKKVHSDIVRMIDSYIQRLKEEGSYDSLVVSVKEFKLSTKIFDVFGQSINSKSIQDSLFSTDEDIDKQFEVAEARLGNEGIGFDYLSSSYDINELTNLKINVILFAANDECIANLNSYAKDTFHETNDECRRYTTKLSEEYRKQYNGIVSDGDDISKHNFQLPKTITVPHDEYGKEYTDHLYVNENGFAKIKLNDWESGVLEEESNRDDFVCWLRNPPKANWSLCIPYEMDGEIRPTYPDFIIIRKDSRMPYGIVIDVLEPHNPAFNDNLGKAKGFAEYARQNSGLGRIELIRKSKDSAGRMRFKRLDMSMSSVRDKVSKAMTDEELVHIFETDGKFE